MKRAWKSFTQEHDYSEFTKVSHLLAMAKFKQV